MKNLRAGLTNDGIDAVLNEVKRGEYNSPVSVALWILSDLPRMLLKNARVREAVDAGDVKGLQKVLPEAIKEVIAMTYEDAYKLNEAFRGDKAFRDMIVDIIYRDLSQEADNVL